MSNRATMLGIATVASAAISSALAAPPATQPIYPGSRMIQSDSLAVEIMDPASDQRYNRGVRFTPIAAIIRAESNGHEFLYHNGKQNPLKAVAGLFGEFDLISDPPGFAEAKIGGTFLKVGVGALTKTRGNHYFDEPYPVVRLADTETQWGDDQVRFVQTLPETASYAYQLSSTVRVEGTSLTIDWSLNNTGRLPIHTMQYLHNSFAFDGRPIGEGCILQLPAKIEVDKIPKSITKGETTLELTEVLKKPANIAVTLSGDQKAAKWLNVTDTASGLSVRADSSLAIDHLSLHAASEYICPEQFVVIDAAPGQTVQWKRSYSFKSPIKSAAK